ncbi:MAG: hypothetical protein NUW07_02035, partial [Candidatus Saccharicenans sp.]|nr:hypothetical protein [Candidatus Saccharicenans sp.]
MKARGWLLLITLLLTAVLLHPAENSRPIERITILVDGQEAEPTVASLLNLKPGQSYSDYQIDQNLKQLMRTGLFSRAEVYYSGP